MDNGKEVVRHPWTRPKKLISVRLELDLVKRIKRESIKEGVSCNQVIARAIANYFQSASGNQYHNGSR